MWLSYVYSKDYKKNHEVQIRWRVQVAKIYTRYLDDTKLIDINKMKTSIW